MEWVETTGRTIDEAKETALDQLGVDEVDAEFEVLSEPKVGFLGRLKGEARVRARVQPTAPRAKDAGNNRRRRPERKERPRRDKPVTKASAVEPRETSANTAADEEPSDDQKSTSGPAGRRRSSQSRHRKPTVTNNEGASAMEDEVALAEQGEVAKTFLTGLFGELNAPAEIDVAVRDDDEIVIVAVEGDGLGHLIGPRGATLQSLQELTRTVVQRKTGARNGRIIVDISKYREKRREALERFSRQVADEVRSSGTQRVLEPMNPADRKVVHDVINEIDGISTSSEGEEPRRRVVIRPE